MALSGNTQEFTTFKCLFSRESATGHKRRLVMFNPKTCHESGFWAVVVHSKASGSGAVETTNVTDILIIKL